MHPVHKAFDFVSETLPRGRITTALKAGYAFGLLCQPLQEVVSERFHFSLLGSKVMNGISEVRFYLSLYLYHRNL